MRIYIFKSASNSELCAFAGGPDTRQLPTKFGPWHAVGVVRPDKAPPYNLSRDAIEKAIAGPGFQLFRLKKKATAD